MKNLYASCLIVVLLVLVSNNAMAQNMVAWPNYPTVVPVVQPVVVQEVQWVPVVQNRVVYQQGVWVYYQPYPYYYVRPYGCRWFWGW